MTHHVNVMLSVVCRCRLGMALTVLKRGDGRPSSSSLLQQHVFVFVDYMCLECSKVRYPWSTKVESSQR